MRRLAFIFIMGMAMLGLLSLESFAATGENAIAVIAAAGHGKNLKKDELALVFKRKKLFWSDEHKIQPVNLPTSNPLRLNFSHAVLGASPEDLEKYWNDMYFHGVSPPHVLASEEAVLRFISDTPGSIGYVSYCRAAGRANILFVITAGGRITEDSSSLECPNS